MSALCFRQPLGPLQLNVHFLFGKDGGEVGCALTFQLSFVPLEHGAEQAFLEVALGWFVEVGEVLMSGVLEVAG